MTRRFCSLELGGAIFARTRKNTRVSDDSAPNG